MLNKISQFTIKLSSILLSLLLLLNLPYLFITQQGFTFQPIYFFNQTVTMLKQVFSPESLVIIGSDPKFGHFKKTPLFPTVLEPYLYSFTILFSAFFLALFLSSSMAFFYFLAKDYIKKWINRIVFILEAVPDMMMMICLQIFFIWVLQKFGESPVTIISFNENRAYLLPILSLAVLPTLQMFRMMVLYIKEEQGKHYVEVAYGKGLSSSYILCIHLFKNISIHFFHHLKTIFVFLLSNLFILEFVFNMEGIIQFLFNKACVSPPAAFIILVMIVLPFYAIFQIVSFMMNRWKKQLKGVSL
ncbi:ABC transporter permease subunit [Bacillus cereus]|uniref:ABC transporter permease subunit n=1 Tax=Bacillus cereus TaxID=1396 RepID=UPI001FF3CE59|nr:ABC transporter permease subunit [Bacillus cereus]MDA2449317.1 ABC transporter permease subunit [Bacillus cereus]MDA2455198.1 ABC transporter permease subunit [Bacillus cereus]UOX98064.1 ABC transporter permease subunit [Bacillus cereus]